MSTNAKIERIIEIEESIKRQIVSNELWSMKTIKDYVFDMCADDSLLEFSDYAQIVADMLTYYIIDCETWNKIPVSGY